MPKIAFSDGVYECPPGETVLECLTRHGVDIPSSCGGGSCQTCMMRAQEGTPPPSAQQGLKPTLQQQGYFLACICRPEEDLTVVVAGDEALPKLETTVLDKTPLSTALMRLRLAISPGFDYRPGQFLNLHRADGVVRSYSIASLPQEGYLELHVESIENGLMSGWIHRELAVGSKLQIDGPHGDCYYLEGKPDQPLLLIGTGSGLAPLWGIARDALARGHRGEIHLFHGSRNTDKLYLQQELRQLAAEHAEFHYTPCISGSEVPPDCRPGRVNEIALAQFNKLEGWRVFLCGQPEMVQATKTKVFLAGAGYQDILADPFTIRS